MIRSVALLAGFLFLLSACGTTRPVPEDRFYELEPVSPSLSVAEPVFPAGLGVAKVTADPLRSGRAVLYRDSRKPLEVKRYHYEYWVDQPPRMVRQALLEYLRASGVADPVRGGVGRDKGDYALQTNLKRFDRLLGAGQPRVEIELEASIYANGSGQPLWSNNYLHRQDSKTSDMHATAEAMQTALATILQSMVEDLAAIGSAP